MRVINPRALWATLLLALALLGLAGAALAAAPAAPPRPPVVAPATVQALAANEDLSRTSGVIRIALTLTLMAVLPALIICMTSFTRIVIVLSMIRHAFGMPETPPNQVLIGLALFLTAFSMGPTFDALNTQALRPFLDGRLTVSQAMDEGSAPLKAFMLRQVRDQDIAAVYSIARKPLPARAADVGLMQLVPAFMLNELRVAFRIGFVVFLPFLLIDLVVSSILLALGMLMVPPSTLSLPIKILMFVLIDGWSLVLQGVMGSFH
ncbi:flagellar type III secretion system pore protein FliP [Flavisphingomonas formosensis]|uniref:flagellar type III secretion system pore protein FliP n=1 Tax=Flavisphingomonas formosensis TaxID=861534 RepID=UPI0012F7A770|nr:flagellar type III secretion system pore protein FliP [Sphingomonas formosensis]